ncbi:MAG: thiol reductase thioredoxin, partial [Bacteroidales bacterium]|nr:thiol reductase thioredoxin [Bacteroidales bacterium]
WCGPCRMIGQIIQEIGQEYEGKVIVGKVDVDNNPEITTKFGIRNIPTVLFFKNGEIVDKQVGSVPKQVIIDKLEAHL